MIYSPTLINDFRQLKTLFTAENELAEMDKIPEVELVRPSDYLYYNRWQVALILITAPLAIVTYLFLKTVALVLWSYQINLLARRALRPIDYLISQWRFGCALWVPSVNEYRLDLTDVFNLSSVKRGEIPDPFIKARLHRKLNRVNFDRIGRGVCWGSCHWFNYLLLKRLKTQPIEKAIVAVAKQFEEGQPRQAALIQSFYGLELDLLDLSSTRVFDRNQDGVYLLSSNDHCVSYIQWEGKEFVWEPCEGLIYLRASENLPKIFEDNALVSATLHSLKGRR